MIDQAQNLRKMISTKNNEVKHKAENPQKNVLVYTITSGKGGVGKSNFTVNLAVEMQKRGRKVLIIDGDYGMANVNVLFGIVPKKSLHDVIYKGVSLKDVVIESNSGVKIISGGSGFFEMTEVSQEKQNTLIEGMLQLNDIDIILIDTSAGVSRNLLSFISFSQEMILVTTPEPTSLTDAYSLIKMVAKMSIKDSIKVVINKTRDEKDADSIFYRLEKAALSFLGIHLNKLGYVVEDSKVKEAVMEQTPFTELYPNCTASKNIFSIVDKLLGQEYPNSKKTTMQHIVSRMMKVFR
jgi:flagellar biosynthesis protein FlhG